MFGLVKLYNAKANNNISDKGFTEILKVLIEMFLEGYELSSSMYEVKKFLSQFEMKCNKIYVCPNYCIFYRKQYKTLDIYPKHNESR